MLATRRTHVDVAQLVEQVCAGFEPRTRDVQLVVSESTRGPIWAEVDPLLVRQAVSNLVDNALGHTPAGGRVSVGVSTRNGSTDVVVEDSGPGFDPDVLPRAFEPFVHADGARRRGSGTGLGLAIVQAVAQAHGGSAEARNTPDGGASVVLHLPA
jgi:signal transduction histidine kinase